MLLDDFYRIAHTIEQEDGSREIAIALNSAHPLYRGHFPGQPIVPGVCTLQIIKECTEQLTGSPLQYVQIASAKFLSAVNPLEESLLHLTLRSEETEDGFLKLQVDGSCKGQGFVRLKAILARR